MGSHSINPSIYLETTKVNDYFNNYKSILYGHIYIIILIVLSLLNDYFNFSFSPLNSNISNSDMITGYIRYFGSISMNIGFLIGIFLLPILTFKFYHEFIAKPDHKILKFHALTGIILFIVFLGTLWFDIFASQFNNPQFVSFIYFITIILEESIFPLIITALAIYKGGNVFLNSAIDNDNSKKLVLFLLLSAFLISPLAYIGQLSSPNVLILLPAPLLGLLSGTGTLSSIIVNIAFSIIDLLYLFIIGILIFVLSLVIPVFNNKQNNWILAVTIFSIVLLNVYLILFTPLATIFLTSISLQNLLTDIFDLCRLNILYCYSIGFVISIPCLFWKLNLNKQLEISK